MVNLRSVVDRPQLPYRVLVPLLVVFWFLSGVGGGSGSDTESDVDWVGQLGWMLFFITFVLTVLLTVIVLARRVLRRSATS